MPDLFEGFRWREVVAVLAAIVFFLLVMIDAVKDLDVMVRTQAEGLRERIRHLEVQQVQLWCAMNPETCMGSRDAPQKR